MTATTVSLDEHRRRSAQARSMPNDVQAEESLLGAMLLSPDAIGVAVEIRLGPDDFYKPAHGHVYAAITALYAKGEPADGVTVSDELARRGHLEEIGGPATLISLQAGTPAINNAARYARIVADHAALRSLIGAAGAIAEDAYELPDDIEAVIDQAEARIYGLRREPDDPLVGDIRAQVHAWLDYIEARTDTGGAIECPTGLNDLDELTGGLLSDRLYLVAGRPGAGKSDVACTIAAYVARTKPVLFWSIEMSREEIITRLVAAQCHLDRGRMGRGQLPPKDWERTVLASRKISELALDIREDPTCTLMGLKAAARRKASRGGLGLVIVDHVGLMTGRGRAENRQVEVAEFARGLKLLARELHVPVVALVQLNRQLESRAEKRPALADLRESGELEQSGDVVIGVFRDELYNPTSDDKGTAELLVLKNRQGPIGMARVAADVTTGRWTSFTKREDI